MMTVKRVLKSETLEPFFATVLSAVTMNLIAAAETKGVDSIEFEREQCNFDLAIEGMKKIASAAETATHARMALHNELARVNKALNALREKLS